MNQLMRLWYLSHRQPAKAQVSLRICTVQSRQSLRSSQTWKVRPKKGWLRIRIWSMNLRRKKSTIISWHVSNYCARPCEKGTYWQMANAQVSLPICTVSPKPSLLAHNVWNKAKIQKSHQAIFKMSQLMRLWHFLSSVNSFFKRACTAIQWG